MMSEARNDEKVLGNERKQQRSDCQALLKGQVPLLVSHMVARELFSRACPQPWQGQASCVSLRTFGGRGDEPHCSAVPWGHAGSVLEVTGEMNASDVWKEPSQKFQQWHTLLLAVDLGKGMACSKTRTFCSKSWKRVSFLVLRVRDCFPYFVSFPLLSIR